jgi:hypothetical protein
MVAVKGRLQNNTFISEENIVLPDGVQVIVTVLDGFSFREPVIPHLPLRTEIENEVNQFCGAWQGNKSAEEIIAEIHDGRVSTRAIASFD